MFSEKEMRLTTTAWWRSQRTFYFWPSKNQTKLNSLRKNIHQLTPSPPHHHTPIREEEESALSFSAQLCFTLSMALVQSVHNVYYTWNDVWPKYARVQFKFDDLKIAAVMLFVNHFGWYASNICDLTSTLTFLIEVFEILFYFLSLFRYHLTYFIIPLYASVWHATTRLHQL